MCKIVECQRSQGQLINLPTTNKKRKRRRKREKESQQKQRLIWHKLAGTNLAAQEKKGKETKELQQQQQFIDELPGTWQLVEQRNKAMTPTTTTRMTTKTRWSCALLYGVCLYHPALKHTIDTSILLASNYEQNERDRERKKEACTLFSACYLIIAQCLSLSSSAMSESLCCAALLILINT